MRSGRSKTLPGKNIFVITRTPPKATPSTTHDHEQKRKDEIFRGWSPTADR